jgi:hypothetical protein
MEVLSLSLHIQHVTRHVLQKDHCYSLRSAMNGSRHARSRDSVAYFKFELSFVVPTQIRDFSPPPSTLAPPEVQHDSETFNNAERAFLAQVTSVRGGSDRPRLVNVPGAEEGWPHLA